jgi:hypothetical protein
MIGIPTIADAILDRVIHNACRLELSGDSLRKRRSAPAKLEQARPRPRRETSIVPQIDLRTHDAGSRHQSYWNAWPASSECARSCLSLWRIEWQIPPLDRSSFRCHAPLEAQLLIDRLAPKDRRRFLRGREGERIS